MTTLASRVLTQKQQAVLGFLQRYFGEHRRSPFIREIQLGCQIASYKSAIDRLNALERKGFIRRIPNKHRGIKVSHHPPEILPRPQPAPAEEPAAAWIDGSRKE